MAKPPVPQGQPRDEGSHIMISTPWGDGCSNVIGGSNIMNMGELLSEEDARNFVETRSRTHELYIREVEQTRRDVERTRRFGMGLAAFLLALACLVPVFAPAGREGLSYLVALALLVFAAGSMGYTTLKFRSQSRQLSVSKDSPEEEA